MKRFLKYILLAPAAVIGLSLTGCSDNDADADKGKTPEVSYFRMTDPGSEHITEAMLGDKIAICGNHLGDVQQVWFNDQKAMLNPAYVTSEVIVVEIPNAISENVTNTVRLVTSQGKSTEVPFNTMVPEPMLTSMTCEWAKPGDVVTISGDYFVTDDEYPLQITFPGGVTVTSESFIEMERTFVTLKVPEGATAEGRITATSRYGEGLASFVWHDTRGMILDWDGTHGKAVALANGWRKGDKNTFTEADGIPGLDGKFILFSGVKADYNDMGEDNFSFNHWPVDENAIASLDISTLFDTSKWMDYCLKFEVFIPTSTPWTICSLNVLFTPASIFGDNTYIFSEDDPYPYPRAMWTPWQATGSYDTGNKWVTVSIPLTDFNKDRYMNPCSRKMTSDDFAGLTMIVCWGPFSEETNVPVTMAIDNIRVAPLVEPGADDEEESK